MIEAYAVGVSLHLQDLVSQPLARLAKNLKEMDLLVASINKNFKGIGAEAAGLKSVDSASAALSRHLAAANLHSEKLQKNLATIKAMGLSGSTTATPIPLPGGGGRRGGWGGGHNGGIHMGPGGIGMSAATIGMGGAFLPLAGAAAGAYWTKQTYESAKDYQTEAARLTLFGMDAATNAAAKEYIEHLKTFGTSRIQNMRFFTEAQGVFRESGLAGAEAIAGAKLATPLLAQIYLATEAMDDESKAKMRTSSLSMLRFVEMRGGLKGAAEFNRIADAGWKAIRSSGGNVDWEQYRQFMARGGVAAQGLTDEVLFGKLEPVIGELKGSTAGNAWMTSYNRLVGGVRIPNQVAHMLAKSGIWDASKITWNSMGGIKSFNGNPLRDAELFAKDPVAFYEQKILPMYQSMGIASATDRARQNTMIFGRSGGSMFSLIDRQLATIHRSEDSWRQALGIGKSVDVAKGTASGVEAEFAAAWTDFKTELGKSVLPQLTRFISGAAYLLRTFTDFYGKSKAGIDAVSGFGGGPLSGMVNAANGIAGGIRDFVFGSSKPAQVTTQVNIDGRKVAEAVTTHQAKAAAFPQTGIAGFDGRLHLHPAGG